jgi:hypothetical protein
MKNIQRSKMKKVFTLTAIFVFLFSAISTDLKSQTSFSNKYEMIKTVSPDNSKPITNADVTTSQASVIVYPNIFTNEINMVFEDLGNSTVIIEAYDISGNKVMSKELNMTDSYGHAQIKTEELTPGIYNLKIMSGNQIIDKTITKKG